ncbi:MAG: Gfo/Idh/MocA family oxidoreductase [Pelagibacteraceae bacterium]|nr:Gfo/Idh/MocA family oxidoreductase [Pelagibacteraceae bacterium]MBT6354796.1 Gfo/Idh/MocA family oxidoreductase [Pelagibacteraceae bacterium]
MKIKIGIVGASFAKAAFLPAFKHLEGVEVTAISSSRIESAKNCAEEFNIKNYYDDWHKMLNQHKFDLVCIATPTDLHAPISIEALKKGANVLCEKPTAMNAAEAAEMLKVANENNKIHMIDHELRFNPNRKKIKEWISSGDIGDIQHINILNVSNGWLSPDARAKNDWWSLKSRGGGRMGANGSHQVDLIRWWCGEIKSVFGQSLTIVKNRIDKNTKEKWTATADDLSHFSLELQNGGLVNVFLSGIASHTLGNKTQIFGSEGTIVLEDKTEEILFAKKGNDFEKLFFEDPNASLEGLNKGIWNVSVVSLLSELTSAIKENRPLKYGSTFEDGLKNQIVVDAVFQSTDLRKWIDI